MCDSYSLFCCKLVWHVWFSFIILFSNRCFFVFRFITSSVFFFFNDFYGYFNFIGHRFKTLLCCHIRVIYYDLHIIQFLSLLCHYYLSIIGHFLGFYSENILVLFTMIIHMIYIYLLCVLNYWYGLTLLKKH